MTQRIFTPKDFERELNARGRARPSSLEPVLTQSAGLVPHPQPRRRDRQPLFRRGAGTHPGAGVPGVIGSAKATAGLDDRGRLSAWPGEVSPDDHRPRPVQPRDHPAGGLEEFTAAAALRFEDRRRDPRRRRDALRLVPPLRRRDRRPGVLGHGMATPDAARAPTSASPRSTRRNPRRPRRPADPGRSGFRRRSSASPYAGASPSATPPSSSMASPWTSPAAATRPSRTRSTTAGTSPAWWG